ncbi:MAG: hypothetical protein ACE37F_28445 [Nannocystaceae bacterium]|nr:hypothetical protein [bacterium]
MHGVPGGPGRLHEVEGAFAPPLSCEMLTLQTASGERRALVLTPTVEVYLSSTPNVAGELSPADRWILERARWAAGTGGATVCMFRGEGPNGCYRFEPSLGLASATALAEEMLLGQLRAYREMVQLGMCLFVHAGFGHLETEAFREATAAVARSLQRLGGATAEVDRWILQNLLFFFTASFEALVGKVLPEKLPMMEKRMDRVRRMAERL